jgi:ribose-phosphate pyrophosphokinase
MEKILFPGSSNSKNGRKLSQAAKIKFGRILIEKFACNEKYVQLLDDVKGKIVYIYQTFSENPDEILMETFLIAEAAKGAGAKKVILISPLLLYSRQDKKTSPEKREPLTVKLLAKLYQASGIDKIITCHLHSEKILNFYKNKILNLKTEHLFAKELKKIIKKERIWQVVAPDEGARKDAKKLAWLLGNLKVGFFEKERGGPDQKRNTISSLKFHGNVKEKNVIIFDDMVDTGQTVIKVKERLDFLGAKKVILATTHPILSEKAKERLEKAGFFKTFFSNSIPLKEKVKNLEIVDIIPEIKKYLQKYGQIQSARI